MEARKAGNETWGDGPDNRIRGNYPRSAYSHPLIFGNSVATARPVKAIAAGTGAFPWTLRLGNGWRACIQRTARRFSQSSSKKKKRAGKPGTMKTEPARSLMRTAFAVYRKGTAKPIFPISATRIRAFPIASAILSSARWRSASSASLAIGSTFTYDSRTISFHLFIPFSP